MTLKAPFPYFGGKSQMHRDRLWLSPSCLAPSSQVGLPGVE